MNIHTIRNLILKSLLLLSAIAYCTTTLAASAPGAPQTRPGLFFEEPWQQISGGGENPISQAHLANSNLELKLYGPAVDQLQITGVQGSDANPVHTWSGLCGAGCVFAFKHKDYYADLSGRAHIMMQSKTSGFHKIRPFVRLADGTTLVGDMELGNTADFLFTDFSVADVNWIIFNTDNGVTRGLLLDEVDLSRVDEIGFVDLQPGADHGAGGWSDVAVIRVYADSVAR